MKNAQSEVSQKLKNELVMNERRLYEELNNPIMPNPVVPKQTAISFNFKTPNYNSD